MTTFSKMIKVVVLGTCATWMTASAGDDPTGSMPRDDAMTCQQIAAELAPYAQQMAGPAMALAQTEQQLVAHGQQRMAQYTPLAVGMSAAATATAADPTGLSSKAYGQVEAATQREIWNRSLAEDKPLADQANQQLNQVMAQAAPMQSNTRIMRLMQLAQERNCH